MLLRKITGPCDIKKLSPAELCQLAEEIRETIVETVTQKTGGHLASSLGAVDLTIALHYSFNAPEDIFIWDVGHQCYAHKLITGRFPKFHTLRQKGGISGFLSPKESKYDTFYTGHAGTALSLADGAACARDRQGLKHRVIAVIGDGSFTSGMTFEALNHIGHTQREVIVILNDNEMSIAKNVGALSRYFNKLITAPVYNKFKDRGGEFISKIPLIGKPLKRILDKAQEFLKSIILPAIIFEELGFRYVGPIDGHNIEGLKDTFLKTRHMVGRPLLIHVSTRKGKGFPLAEEDPEEYHGVAVAGKTGQTFTRIFSDTICRIAQEDRKVTAITAAMRDGTGLKRFAKLFPERFFDVGIAEQHAVAFASGQAKYGLKPFVAIYSTFLQRAYDQLIHDVALQGIPVKFMLDRAGIVGEDGPTHNGVFDLSYLTHIPGLVVLSPRDGNEFQHLIYSVYLYNKGPVVIRYPRGFSPDVPMDKKFHRVDFFRNEILRKGKDVLILATGFLVHEALQAAQILSSKYGVKAWVVNCRCLKPLDKENILGLARNVKCIVTVEENVITGGFGSSVNTLLAINGIHKPSVRNIGIPDQFLSIGSQKQLRTELGLTADGIVQMVLTGLKRKKGGN
jgi:1-deoxy-D-xylulose-5-phosphate synthase